MEKLRNHWLFPYIVFPLGYVIIVATSYLYRKPLFDWSLTAIENLQVGVTDGSWQFWKIYTEIGGANL